jgi:hypothetical protein
MENRNILFIIIAILIIALVGTLIFLNLKPVEEQEVEQNNQQQQEEQQAEQNIEQGAVLDPIVQRALEIRQTTEIISGVLVEVGNNYFVIEQSVPEENQDMFDPEVELKYIQERIKVNITPDAQIFDLSDIKHIAVPANIIEPIETLNYLYDHSDDYVINAFIAAGSPVANGEIETSYIEWSSWPKGGF